MKPRFQASSFHNDDRKRTHRKKSKWVLVTASLLVLVTGMTMVALGHRRKASWKRKTSWKQRTQTLAKCRVA